jgi:saccharopine dehydrogenase-like NADP-dependent oxidoreductase
MKTVVLGGYGNFGARICRALALRPEIDLIIAGRNQACAERLANDIGGRATAEAIDAADPALSQRLRALGAELVIHTAGPFQQQGYAVPLATAAAGAHYIDLADGRRFVCDFDQANGDAFRRRGRTAVTGASTVPSLSSAVVDALCAGWRSIDSIDVCIAPAQTAPRGVATMAAVLDYCGAPIQVWENGVWITRYGWDAPQAVTFSALRPRQGALCDIPDLEIFPQHYPGVRTVMFRAALEIPFTQRALAVMAKLRRAGLVRSPARFAKAMHTFADWMNPFGSGLGGMVVRVSGRDREDQPVRYAWHLTADDDHGPEIPCMPSILLAERLARGVPFAPGARSSISLLSLADFRPEFAKWKMSEQVVQEAGVATTATPGEKQLQDGVRKAGGHGA